MLRSRLQMRCCALCFAALAVSTGAAVHDFTAFEDDVLPAWLQLFTVNISAGQFSYKPSSTPDLYGSVDVIHVLDTTGQLVNLSAATRDAWAAQIDSYQNPDGFYNHSSSNSKYHAAGEATASLALLGRLPRFNNSAYEAFASGTGAGPATWAPFFDSLYFNNCSGVLAPGKEGCGSSIHGCGQVIGSLPSVLAYTTGAKHATFIRWWSGWLASRTNATTGTLAPKTSSLQDLYDSLGGGMATHGIQLGIAGGDPVAFPFELAAPAALLRFALSLQDNSTGLFQEIGSMSLDGIFQTVRSAEQLDRWDQRGWGGGRAGGGSGGNTKGSGEAMGVAMAAAQHACDLLLATSAKQLNDRRHVLDTWGRKSHDIANVLAAVGECARAFPQLVRTRRPWGCCARYV